MLSATADCFARRGYEAQVFFFWQLLNCYLGTSLRPLHVDVAIMSKCAFMLGIGCFQDVAGSDPKLLSWVSIRSCISACQLYLDLFWIFPRPMFPVAGKDSFSGVY